ncbi:MAG: B12-binding domain-containing radical SAM protein, partial [Planctomycetota bacterium]
MKFKRALFIYPYYRELPVYGFFPPLGLEYVREAVDDLLEWSALVDFRWEEDLETSFREIVADGVDLICVSVNWHFEFDSVCEIIRALPHEVTTIVGGTHATQNVEELFRDCPNIDVIVRGDGEETLREFVEKGSPDGVAGLSYRGAEEVIHNDNRVIQSVSEVQYPDRTKRRYNYRATYQKVDLGYSFDTMVASRGCPYNCKFCSFKRNPLGQKRAYSERTPESVIEELKQIDAELVAFLDDNFFVNIKRAERICDLIIREKMNKIFIVNARINIASHPRLLEKMHRAGFRLLMIGIESAQDKSLKSLSKGFDTAKAREAFEVLRKSNMMTGGYFIVGLIGETKEE